jgi:hypothetical protein
VILAALAGIQALDGRSISHCFCATTWTSSLYLCFFFFFFLGNGSGLFITLIHFAGIALHRIAIASSSSDQFVPHTTYGTMANPGGSNAATMHYEV